MIQQEARNLAPKRKLSTIGEYSSDEESPAPSDTDDAPEDVTEEDSDDQENLGSPISSKSDATFQPIPFTTYAEKLKLIPYALNFRELGGYEDSYEEGMYDEESAFEERLQISSINICNSIPKEYKLVPKVLEEEEYEKIRQWRRCVVMKENNFPPSAATSDQLHLNTLLCHIGCVLNDAEEDPSEIGFIVESVSPVLRFEC